MSQQKFVKSASTDVPVSRSQGELEKILRRYGCSAFGVRQDYENLKAEVTFRVPDGLDKDAPSVPVRLVIDVRAVYDSLYGQPTRWNGSERVYDPKGYREKEVAQADRVAWRHIVLWVDAACSAASTGVQRMSEAFLAHTLVRAADGRVMRVVEQMNAAAGGDWKALLPPPGNA